MSHDDVRPKLGRIGNRGGKSARRFRTLVLKEASRAGRLTPRGASRFSGSRIGRGRAIGGQATQRAFVPGTRRVVIKVRIARHKGGDLGAARAHLRYIQRDGVTREGGAGQLYDRAQDDADGKALLGRSAGDRHQFRLIVSPEDSSRLEDLKPFVRDLMARMEQDLGTRLEWVAVDHFNTGHPHSHIVVRGKDERDRDLVIARNYISHGIRHRAEELVTLELGPENATERKVKLQNEVAQERLTNLDRSLLRDARDGIVVARSESGRSNHQTALRAGRLRTLERLGLAEERRPGVWVLAENLEPALRDLGERADRFATIARTLRDAGLERPAASFATFDPSQKNNRIVGKVIGTGLADEVSDKQFVVLDGVDGRVYYAEHGRSPVDIAATPGAVVAIASGPAGTRAPTVELLSSAAPDRGVSFDGPTWLDRVIVSNRPLEVRETGFGADLHRALDERRKWLSARGLSIELQDGTFEAKPNLLATLRHRHMERLGKELAAERGQSYATVVPGDRISGIYERDVTTPGGRMAIIRSGEQFALAPWHNSLERYRGREVRGLAHATGVSWTLGRSRPGPTRA